VHVSPEINKLNTKKPAAICSHAYMSVCLSIYLSVCFSASPFFYVARLNLHLLLYWLALTRIQFQILSYQSFHYSCLFYWVSRHITTNRYTITKILTTLKYSHNQISRFNISASGIGLTVWPKYKITSTWIGRMNREVVCTCKVSRVTGYFWFIKFYWWISSNRTFNFFIMPARSVVISHCNGAYR